MRVSFFATGLTVGFALALHAQAPGPLEFGLYPTARKLTTAVAPPTNWSAGATVSAGYWFTDFTGVEATAYGGFAPQLNQNWQSQLNEIMPTMSLVVGTSRAGVVQPYVLGGIGYERFRFPPPLDPPHDLSVGTAHAGAGVNIRLGTWSALRIEGNTQFGARTPSFGLMTGLSVFPGSHRRADAPRLVYVTDTVREHVVDTLRLHVTDSVRVTQVLHLATNTVLVLKDASFDIGRSELRPEARAALDAAAIDLTAEPARNVRIAIVGHTDNVGSPTYNYNLGLARATSVRDYLASRGVDASRMRVASAGLEEPIADNRTAAGRQLNRRVVITRVE
jgi:outer membrane protein OmpA-like peptidoglycan-associated protein